jgi:Adenylate and Guanylate cyclase catalytic domain
MYFVTLSVFVLCTLLTLTSWRRCRNNPKAQAESESWTEWFREYLPSYENPYEPLFDLHYPIINNISHAVQSTIDPDTMTKNAVVAILVVEIYWRDLIRDILPEGSNGIIVEVESPCNEKFSYQIFGPEVKFLGIGDSRNAKYRHLEKSGNFANFSTLTVNKDEYSGIPVAQEFCPYTLHVYPSDIMNADFKTSNGVIFLVSMICIFAFISMIFYLYDRKVERHQRKIALNARQSSAMISSLFPSTVRDQLYEAKPETKHLFTQWRLPFLQSTTAGKHVYEQTNGGPIAQLYENTTVIFMRIVGFKQWSANRPPTHIFQLLEMIYAKFDELAKFHRVFKVETIGDSYVAVVGLPSPRKRHAVVTARFANDCREGIEAVLKKLEESLGQVRNNHRVIAYHLEQFKIQIYFDFNENREPPTSL